MLSYLRNLRDAVLGRNSAGPDEGTQGDGKVQGSYDAAATTPENREHWENADSLSANAAHDPGTRRLLRDRARYEVSNNSYARGLVRGMARDLVGTGPRLGLSIPGLPREAARQVERAFANHSLAADLAEDLRVLHTMQVRDGEGFGLHQNNPALPRTGRTPCTIDLRLYESEQVSDPFDFGFDPTYLDGVKVDDFGNPESYTFLQSHPGGMAPWLAMKTEKIPASHVRHWFQPDRAGQTRGVTHLVAGLPLFAQMRRYTLATLGAAELAACMAGIMKTNSSAQGVTVQGQEFEKVKLPRNALITLPFGYEATQFKPEQPVAGFKEFKGEVIGEIGRGADAPFNVISGNSSGYNYSSGRLDHLLYQACIRVERSRMRARVLDPFFLAWLGEAVLCGAVPLFAVPISQWTWNWYWDGFDTLDPLKDAQADNLALANGTTTLAEVYGRKGMDWEEQIRQRGQELALMRELGLPTAPATSAASPALADQPQAPEEVDDADTA